MAFEIGKRYNFNTIAPITLNNSYKNMVVVASGLNLAIASAFADLVTVHEKIKAETSTIILNSNDAIYVIFENEYGDKAVLSTDWIDNNSVELLGGVSKRFTINNISDADTTAIRNALNILGYDVAIETI